MSFRSKIRSHTTLPSRPLRDRVLELYANEAVSGSMSMKRSDRIMLTKAHADLIHSQHPHPGSGIGFFVGPFKECISIPEQLLQASSPLFAQDPFTFVEAFPDICLFPDVTTSAFKEFVKFLQDDAARVTSANVLDLIAIADQLECTRVKQTFLDAFDGLLTPDNLIWFFQNRDKYINLKSSYNQQAPEPVAEEEDVGMEEGIGTGVVTRPEGPIQKYLYETRVVDLLDRAMSLILAQDLHLEFSFAEMVQLARRDSLRISEERLFQALLRWTRHYSYSPETALTEQQKTELFLSVRLPFVTAQFLAEEVSPASVLPQNVLLAVISYLVSPFKCTTQLDGIISQYDIPFWYSQRSPPVNLVAWSLQCKHDLIVLSYLDPSSLQAADSSNTPANPVLASSSSMPCLSSSSSSDALPLITVNSSPLISPSPSSAQLSTLISHPIQNSSPLHSPLVSPASANVSNHNFLSIDVPNSNRSRSPSPSPTSSRRSSVTSIARPSRASFCLPSPRAFNSGAGIAPPAFNSGLYTVSCFPDVVSMIGKIVAPVGSDEVWESGKHAFEVTIDLMDAENPDGIIVGLVRPSFNFSYQNVRDYPSAWGYISDGSNMHRGYDWHDAGQVGAIEHKPFKQGDAVGIVVDLDKGIVEFLVNGEIVGDHFHITPPVRPFVSMVGRHQVSSSLRYDFEYITMLL